MHRAAGSADDAVYRDAGDIADTWREYEELNRLKDSNNKDEINRVANLKEDGKLVFPNFKEHLEELRAAEKRDPRQRYTSGTLRTFPFFEDRGPNPYLLLTGQTQAWERGGFWDWALDTEVPVLLEPLVKMVRPIVYLLHPDVGFINALYFLLVLLSTVLTWAFFGGAITRIAAVQVARQEKLTLPEAVNFAKRRLGAFATAPLFPLLFVFFLLVVMVIFGVFHMIPWFGEIVVDGLFWPIMLVFGLLMAVALIGLIGWPLMSATISTEGTDSWEAVSRSYSYVFQAPWNYLGYWVLALAYGAVLILFVGFMGSFTVYLSGWGVSRLQPAPREPSYLFVYAPTSFGWRNLMLKSAQLEDGTPVVDQRTGEIIPENYNRYVADLSWYKRVGAVMVAFWVWLFFLLILGFGYSYFWSVSVIIYLLMRKKVDDAEMDEVYLEEDEGDGYAGPLTAPAPAGAAPQPPARAPSLTMVESPTLKPPAPAPAPPPSTPLPTPEPPISRTPDTPAAPSPAPQAPSPAPKTQLAPPEEAGGPEPPPPAPEPPKPSEPAGGEPPAEKPPGT